MAEDDYGAPRDGAGGVGERVEHVQQRQREKRIGGQTVKKLRRDRIVDEIGPPGRQPPERLEGRREAALHQRPGVVDEARAQSGDEAAKLVQILLSTRIDERLEPLRITLNLEGDAYREGVFSWKGFLYYKWMLTRLWPELNAVGGEIARLSVTGNREVETARYIDETRKRLRQGIVVERKSIMRALDVYDRAFEDLIDNGKPQAFREFLLRAPDMFLSLGEKVGVIAHIASFWRYRFQPGQPLVADVDEAVDIFQDFDAGLSTSRAF